MKTDKYKDRFVQGTVGAALVEAEQFKRDTVAAIINEVVVDLQAEMPNGAEARPVAMSDDEALPVIRHSMAHVMADAVQRLFPGTKVTIGPSIETGFYYDFDRPEGSFNEDDLAAIEEKIKEIVAEGHKFEREVVTREEARKVFDELGETYKLEILDGIDEDEPITLYRHGKWVDLCAGPHLPDIRAARTFKLLSSAGAYWRGDEHRKMLSRIYGTAFADNKALKKYLQNIEEAKKRDHRKLGKELELFSVDDQIGGGLILWHPRGARVRTLIEDHWRKAHFNNGYELVITPHIGRAHLWETSGHLENYKDDMYAPMEVEGNPYYIKPMNCPFHIGIYRSRLWSYRDLPMRWGELGTVYRHERSGQLHGLMRVRGFTQDDAHLFMTEDQLGDEIRRLLKFTVALLANFGFEDLDIRLSTRPEEKFVGELEIWDYAEKALQEALDAEKIDYTIDKGEGAFYGPKIDVKIRDAIGRTWQCSTIQCDFNLPERFKLTYVDSNSERKRPVMIHRTILGSMERFIGVMIEHYSGAFPMWLAPEQVAILTVGQHHGEYAKKVEQALLNKGIRVVTNLSNDKLGAKIKDARLMRIPVMAVIGDKEVSENGVTPRSRREGDKGFMSLENFIEWTLEEAKEPTTIFESTAKDNKREAHTATQTKEVEY